MKSSTHTDVRIRVRIRVRAKVRSAPPFVEHLLTPVGIRVGLPAYHGFTILTCDIIAFLSGWITAASTVVLQWACSTAAATRPQYPGDAAHPKVSLKSDTKTSSTT